MSTRPTSTTPSLDPSRAIGVAGSATGGLPPSPPVAPIPEAAQRPGESYPSWCRRIEKLAFDRGEEERQARLDEADATDAAYDAISSSRDVVLG